MIAKRDYHVQARHSREESIPGENYCPECGREGRLYKLPNLRWKIKAHYNNSQAGKDIPDFISDRPTAAGTAPVAPPIAGPFDPPGNQSASRNRIAGQQAARSLEMSSALLQRYSSLDNSNHHWNSNLKSSEGVSELILPVSQVSHPLLPNQALCNPKFNTLLHSAIDMIAQDVIQIVGLVRMQKIVWIRIYMNSIGLFLTLGSLYLFLLPNLSVAFL